jgi:uncharacterized small protein (DUF1192 family)
MSALAIDTLKYARRLQAGGFTQEQAVAAAEAMAEAIGEAVVTRDHLDLRLAELGGRIETGKAELAARIETVKAELTAEIERTKAELLKWMVGAMIAQTGLIVALIKLIP